MMSILLRILVNTNYEDDKQLIVCLPVDGTCPPTGVLYPANDRYTIIV